MSAPDRRAIRSTAPDRTLSLRRQCALLGVARSGVSLGRASRPTTNDRRADALDRRTVHCVALFSVSRRMTAMRCAGRACL